MPCCLSVLKEPLLHLLQQIEAHEDIVVVVELEVGALGHLAIEGPFVGQLLRVQPLVEAVIDVAHVRPQAQESLLELRVVVFAEVAEEAAYDLLLLLAEVAHVVHLADVAQVGKHLVGIGHVLVEVVEVGHEQLPPAVEVVEGLVDARLLGEAAMQVAHQLHGVGHGQR